MWFGIKAAERNVRGEESVQRKGWLRDGGAELALVIWYLAGFRPGWKVWGSFVVKYSVLAGAVACLMLAQPAQQTVAQAQAPQTATAQQAIPDAPRPQQ